MVELGRVVGFGTGKNGKFAIKIRISKRINTKSNKKPATADELSIRDTVAGMSNKGLVALHVNEDCRQLLRDKKIVFSVPLNLTRDIYLLFKSNRTYIVEKHQNKPPKEMDGVNKEEETSFLDELQVNKPLEVYTRNKDWY